MSVPDHTSVARLLRDVAAGRVSADDALARLHDAPAEDLGFAHLDHHRPLRCGMPEVVYGEGKTPEQIGAIGAALKAKGHAVLVTRFAREAYDACRATLDGDAPGDYDPTSRTWVWHEGEVPVTGEGTIVVACAGTSDLPVAEEAARTAEALGNRVERVVDVGVAGLHRTLAHLDVLREARVCIVVAGMEGALPSVVAGLVPCPVIGVPTSVGYGIGLSGITPLFAMLNSCAAGVTVVNIDNGFGAACAASLINHPASAAPARSEAGTATHENGHP